jgi:hypothetical protein
MIDRALIAICVPGGCVSYYGLYLWKRAMTPAMSSFDSTPFNLACGHAVVLGRLEKEDVWICEQCNVVTNLRSSPYREELAHDRDTADQIDKPSQSERQSRVRAG